MMLRAMLNVLVLACGIGVAQGQDDPDTIYRAGTDSAMRYLAEHGKALRSTLLLQECGLPDMARAAGADLPNSVQWFASGQDAVMVSPEQVQIAAQVTRGYLLGFETGVRLEFQRMSDDLRLAACNAAALALDDQ